MEEVVDVPKQYLRWLRIQPDLRGPLVNEIDAALNGESARSSDESFEDVLKTLDETLVGTYSVRPSGNIGQVVLDPDGKVIAWTTDSWIAQVIVKLLNENEHLLLGNWRIEKWNRNT